MSNKGGNQRRTRKRKRCITLSQKRSWEIKQPKPQGLSRPFSPSRVRLSFLKNSPPCSPTPPSLFLPFFIPPYESSPRLPLHNPNYSGGHCVLDSLPLVHSRQTSTAPADRPIRGGTRGSPLCFCSAPYEDKLQLAVP